MQHARARARLREWIARSQFGSDREAARFLGIHYTFLSQLLGGVRSPGLRNAIAIERITGIPAEAWLPTQVGESADCDLVGVRKPNTCKA